MMKALRNLKTSKSGASAAEYALIITLVGLAIIAGAGLLGTNIGASFNSAAGTINP